MRGIRTAGKDGVLYRSRTEANFAGTLSFFDVKYEYEPVTFTLKYEGEDSFKYTPDFLLPVLGYWVELSHKHDPRINVKFSKCIQLSKADKPVLFITCGGSRLNSLHIWIIENGEVQKQYYNDLDLLFKDLKEN